MVNTLARARSDTLRRTTTLVTVYVVVVVATIVVLAALAAAGSSQSTTEAWVHAVIVGVFAVLLLLRLRSARRGSDRALAAVGVIAAVLVVVDVVEAAVPGLFPVWMRVETVGLAVVTAAVALTVARGRRRPPDLGPGMMTR